MQTIPTAPLIVASIGPVLLGFAACIRAWFWGKAELIRAKNGEPPTKLPRS